MQVCLIALVLHRWNNTLSLSDNTNPWIGFAAVAAVNRNKFIARISAISIRPTEIP